MRALKEGLKFHAHVLKSGFIPPIFVSNQLIDLYSKHGLTNEAHTLFDEMPDRNVFSWNTIISSYIKSGNLGKAKALFDSSPVKDSVTYNSIISGYARLDGFECEAIKLFVQMQFDVSAAVRIDEFTLTTILNLAAKVRVLNYGKQVHPFMVKSGNDLSGFALSSLIDMYSKCGSFEDACRVVNGYGGDSVVKNALIAACVRQADMGMASGVFSSEPELNDVVSWNTMISGYVQNGCDEEAVKLCKLMIDKGFRWNEHTFVGLLAACGSLKWLKLGKEAHARVLREGICLNRFISSAIVDVYSKCGNMKYAERVHEEGGKDNVFSTTSMIVGYAARGNMSDARQLFNSMPVKNFVVWTAIISGYVKLQRCEEAFAVFREYTAATEMAVDAVILISLLCACATQASVSPGKQIHAYMIRMGLPMDEKPISALIDMYSKCGFLLYAKRVFQNVSSRDSVIYNIMIAGCAHHGYENEAFNLFDEMIEQGLQPDAVTFIALLSACRHFGLVEKGEEYFSSMTRDYAIPPEMDHYACMVDLYGRSKQVEKAAAFMEKMPMEPDPIMLSSFLNACRVNKNLELARMGEKKLMEIEGENGARYVQLARIYGDGGMWEEMGRVMRRMRGKEVKKLAGCSWVNVGTTLHTFISGDTSHSEATAIYCTLDSLITQLCGKDRYNSATLEMPLMFS